MNDPKDRDAILYAFAVEPNHDQKTLEQYLRQYPELAEGLIDLAFELRILATQPLGPTAPVADPAMQNAWLEFINRKPAGETCQSESVLARFKGRAFADLARSAKLPRAILTALRDGLVEPSSVPKRMLVRLAEEAKSSLQEIRDAISVPPKIQVAAQFKSSKKPSPQERVSFRTLVENTPMSDDQRQALLQDCDADGL